MGGAIPPLPYTPSWRGAQLKQRDNFIVLNRKLHVIHTTVILSLV